MSGPVADLLILGGGPAGCAAGMGLARLGYRVTLVTLPRRQPALEGLSERVVQALTSAGCERALATLGPTVRRQAAWAGQASAANREVLVERSAFDAALQADAMAAGVMIRQGRAGRLTHGDAGWCADDGVRGRFLIEARGRAASGRRRRGPATTALAGRLTGVPACAASRLAAAASGWAWYATLGDGVAHLLLTVAHPVPRRGALAARWRALAAMLGDAAGWRLEGQLAGPVIARPAEPNAALALLSDRHLRIGDAALAMDPLAGHGLFEALASARAAVPVVNTLLARPAAAGLAQAFYQDRQHLTFERLATLGRAFYAAEQRWPEAPFWQARRRWPEAVTAPPATQAPAIARRPVIEGDWITAQEVIVTPEQPRGVWLVEQVPLVPLLRLAQATPTPDAASLAAQLGRPPAGIATALAWLRHRQLLPSTMVDSPAQPASR